MDSLLQQGIAAYKAGKRDEARKLFISAVEQDPDNERAWQWMYNVCNTDKGRIHCLTQILRINPNNKKANELSKQISTSKGKSKSGKLMGRTAIFASIVSVCLIGICAIGLIFTNNNLVASNPSQETPIPAERIIEMTFSAADTQTAISFSPIPLSTATPAPATILLPTATVFIFGMQTQAQLVNTPLPVYETNTPFQIYGTGTPFISSTSSTPSSGGVVCSCDSNESGCKYFSTHKEAQACYDYCKSLGYGDIRRLDGNDNDGIACESLP
jgi:hypothetical protein